MKLRYLAASILFFMSALGCTTETSETTYRVGGKAEAPQGFFGKLADQVTDRECDVVKFTCPYGFGPAGEPCDCTDPKGIVLRGWTVK
jgi:hypothetical protein